MPPKKKDDSKAPADGSEMDDGAERELVEKELVIGYLKSKLGRYQEHGDHLQIENIKLAEDLENQKLNLRDINEFLTNELKARSLTTSALESKVYELNNMVEELRKSHEAALAKQRAEKDKETEALRATLAEFEKKARTMQEFLERKDNMEAELQALRADLAAKVKDYEHRLTDMDRSHIQDREKWKRETLQKIKETKIQMMKLTDNQLEMTTKRTIMENEQMSIELHYQSRQTEKLVNKNTLLLEENQDLRRQLSLSKQTQEELARRNNVYQKTIKSLLVKLQDQGSVQEQHAPIIKALEERVADLELAQHLSKLQSEEQEQQLQAVQARLASACAAAEASSAAQEGAVRFLMQCLDDVKSKIVTISLDDPMAAALDADQTPLPSLMAAQKALEPDVKQPVQLDRHLFSVSITDPTDTDDPEAEVVASSRMPRAHSRRVGGAPSRSASFTGNPKMAQSRASSMRAAVPEISVASGRLEDLSQEQRERVLSYLLERMHVFMHQQALGIPDGQQQLMAQASGHSARFGRRASTRIPLPTNDSSPPTHRSNVAELAEKHLLMPRRSSMARNPNLARAPSLMPGQLTSHALPPDLASSTASLHASWPLPALQPAPADRAIGFEQEAGMPLPAALQPISDSVSPSGKAADLHDIQARQPGQPLAPELPQQPPMPAVDDLLAQVMADVRPWGKKAADSLVAGGPIAAARNGGLFIKKPPGKSSGSPRA